MIWKKTIQITLFWMGGMCLGLALGTSYAFAKNISMHVGQSQVLKLEHEVTQVATGEPNVCEAVKTGANEVLINAVGAGTTNILFWDHDRLETEIQVVVSARNTTELAEELRQVFKNVEGVKVKVIGTTIAVEGEVFSKKDLDRVTTVLQEVDGVINLVKMSPILREILAGEIQQAINLKGVRVRNAKDSFILEGLVDNESERIRAEKIASAYTDKMVSVISVIDRSGDSDQKGLDKMIQLTLNIMELENGALQDFGMHWNPGITGEATGTISSGSTTGQLFGTVSNFFPKMRRVRENGKGRALFQQTVVTKNNKKAKFFVGDQIPIPVAQQGGTMSIEYKSVGLTLDFVPALDVEGNIDILVDIESSAVSGEGLGGAPRVSDTNLHSAVYLKDTESIALGGLIGQREARTLAKAPPGGGGEAFAQLNDSKRFQNDETQVLIFVTPQILKRSSDAVKEMTGEIKGAFKQYEIENLKKPEN